MSRPIPEIRKRLYELAEEHGIDELRTLADATRRKQPVTRAPKLRSNKLNEHQVQMIEQLRTQFPHMSQHDIAARVGTNQGRVSEYLNRQAA